MTDQQFDARVQQLPIHVDDQEYAPVAGLWELRETVAALYNRLYRRGHEGIIRLFDQCAVYRYAPHSGEPYVARSYYLPVSGRKYI